MADPSAMTVAQLRAELKNRGLDTTGLKADLAARLQAARRSAGNSAHADGSLKRKRDPTTAAVVPTTVRYLQRGAISIVDAVADGSRLWVRMKPRGRVTVWVRVREHGREVVRG